MAHLICEYFSEFTFLFYIIEENKEVTTEFSLAFFFRGNLNLLQTLSGSYQNDDRELPNQEAKRCGFDPKLDRVRAFLIISMS